MVWQPVSYASPGEVVAAGVALPVLAVIVVAARFYTRTAQHAKKGADDWLILLALFPLIGMGITLIYGVAKKVLGYKTPKVEYSTEEEALNGVVPDIIITAKIEYSFQLLMITALGLTKLSVVNFCRRVFVVQKKMIFDTITIALITIVTCWTLGFLLAFAFDCKLHFSANWGSAEDIIRYCGGGQAGEKALAISDLITDLLVIILPLPMVWRLHASVSRKLAVSGVFLLGAMAIAASIARLAIYLKLFSLGSDPNRDRDETITITIYWSIIETSLALIAACLPSIRFLFGGGTPASLVRSIRSAISLRSLRSSQRSKQSQNLSQPSSQYKKMSAPERLGLSEVHLAGDLESGPESIITTGEEELKDMSKLGEIHAQKSIRQEDNMM